ncbi:raffinose/stachyose/melibiose transport system permease protein [Devosia lucknowensis]|uniref:Raffinose/stachyose/melibiose transport system permease protein n=1 Tax=Devosia lucknowensis TaxID=1096929 RepID=A0A1Y6G6E4_9HYPH|nr:sugar ABC transporter permease [Devosia lucknowensis]SMQ85344.1 raffinose/stachyose/melibiose transport system permease protein [Devosia lucknowensis]
MPQFRMTGRGLWITALIVPPLCFVALFIVYPIISAFAYAFFDWQGLKRLDFVGFENFHTVLFVEPYRSWTLNAFKNNIIVFFALMVLQNGLGFILAYALWRELPGARFHRIAVFLPVVLSTIIVAYLFKLFYHPLFGVVNISLKSIGLGEWAQPWLGQSGTALWSIIVAQAWHMVGFPTLVFLAGMQRIPSEILDAVRMETESEWVKISKIVWPLVAPSATIVFTLLFVGAFNWFELPYIMGGLDGSPFGSTDVLGLYFYRTAFGNVSSGQQDFGLGSALAVLIFIFIAAIAAVITTRLRAREIQL